jgi:hypothetical protein
VYNFDYTRAALGVQSCSQITSGCTRRKKVEYHIHGCHYGNAKFPVLGTVTFAYGTSLLSGANFGRLWTTADLNSGPWEG